MLKNENDKINAPMYQAVIILAFKILVASIFPFVVFTLLSNCIDNNISIKLSVKSVLLVIGIYFLVTVIDYTCSKMAKKNYIFTIFSIFRLSFILASYIISTFFAWQDNNYSIFILLYIVLTLPTTFDLMYKSFEKDIEYCADFIRKKYRVKFPWD